MLAQPKGAVPTVTLDKAPAEDVTIVYTSSSGTATDNTDYTGTTGTMRFWLGRPQAPLKFQLRVTTPMKEMKRPR